MNLKMNVSDLIDQPMATGKQIKLLFKITAKMDWRSKYVERLQNINTLTKIEASIMIDTLINKIKSD